MLSKAFLGSAVLSLCGGGASASSVYFVENSETVPGKVNLWKADTIKKSATKLALLDTGGTMGVVSGAAVCGHNYLAAWDTFPTNYGLLQVDLSSDNYTHIFNEGDYLFHAVGCHPTDANKALVIGSTPSADTSALFSLITFDLATKQQTKVADFPDTRQEFFEGMDSAFRFEADGKTAIMTIGKVISKSSEPHQGYVFTMDTTTGNLTGDYTTRLHALDTVFDGLKRAITLDQGGDEWKLSWADLSCTGHACYVKVTGSAQDDWDNGKPFAMCGDTAWMVQMTGNKNQPFRESSITAGSSTALFDLVDVGVSGEAGGMAADCSTLRRVPPKALRLVALD